MNQRCYDPDCQRLIHDEPTPVCRECGLPFHQKCLDENGHCFQHRGGDTDRTEEE